MPPRRPLAPPNRPRTAAAVRSGHAHAGRRSIAAAVAALLVGGLLVPGCAREAVPDPLGREPALLIDGPALLRLLDRGQALAGTPAGRVSIALRERLKACTAVAGHFTAAAPNPPAAAGPLASHDADTLDAVVVRALPDRLVCRDDPALDPALADHLERERGPHAGVLQWPLGETGRLVLQIDVDATGGLAVAGQLDAPDEAGPLALLAPAGTAPAQAAIDPAATLLHLRLRPAAGLQLAEWIPQGSQGDRLFALKGRLLEGTLLEGTLELAFVPPAPGGSVPLALIALHHRAAAPVEAALAESLARLERTWGIARTARSFETGAAHGPGPRQGGCYANLPILPEFAPCWVVTERALLLGYRAEALQAALAAPDAAPATTSGLVLDLERVRSLDEALSGVGAPAVGLAGLYSRLELRGHTAEDGRVLVEGELRARP